MSHEDRNFVKEIAADGVCLLIGERITLKPQLDFSISVESGSIRELTEDFGSKALDNAAKANISAVVTLSRNDNFENRFKEHLDGAASGWAPCICEKLVNGMTPPKSVPIYKLLGSLLRHEHSSVVSNEANYLQRRHHWPSILKEVSNHIRHSPIVCIGHRGGEAVLADALNSLLLSLPNSGAGKKIIFSKEEINELSPLLSGLVKQCEVKLLNISTPEIVSCLSHRKRRTKSEAPRITEPTYKFENELLAGIPTIESVESTPPEKKKFVRELLAAPTIVDWRPFKARLDWKRTLSEDIVQSISQAFDAPLYRSNIFSVRGDAGVGKTSVLKRAAFNLAQDHFAVYWFNNEQGNIDNLHNLIQYLNSRKDSETLRVVFFIDHLLDVIPSYSEILHALSPATFNWLIVVSWRATDALRDESLLSIQADQSFEVPSVLSQEEFTAFEEYIGSISKVSSQFFNQNKSNSREAKDCLCLLWILLPETKGYFRETLAKEFLSLSNPKLAINSAIEAIAVTIAEFGPSIKLAYEIVCVAANIGLTVPLEVLTKACNLSWDEWSNMSRDESHPIWGLLYEEPFYNRDTESFESIYRPRNSVIAQVVTELVNGGPVGKDGEFSRLKLMLSTCDAISAVYSKFISDILIRNANYLSSSYTPRQHEELWEIIKEVYPVWSKNLAHHYGIFVKLRLNDASSAYKIFLDAQNQPNDPSGIRRENPANIENSAAAAIVRLVAGNEIRASEAFDKVELHLTRAKKFGAFSLHSAHIQGTNFMHLANEIGNQNRTKRLECIEKAYEITNEAIILNEDGGDELLYELKSKLFKSTDYKSVEEMGQHGLSLIVSERDLSCSIATIRLHLEKAKQTMIGTDFKIAEAYLLEVVEVMGKVDLATPPTLLRLRIELYMQWRFFLKRKGCPWGTIKDDCESLFELEKGKSDPLTTFYLAVALLHLKDGSTACDYMTTLYRSSFMRSSVRRSIRAFAQDYNGNPASYSGEIIRRGERVAVSCPEIGTTLNVKGALAKKPNNTSIHFRIGITLSGFYAVPTNYEIKTPFIELTK